MKKLFCLILSAYVISSCQDQVPANKEIASNEKKVTTLQVDKSALSASDLAFIEKVDSLCTVIDSDNTLLLHQLDTSFVQNSVNAVLSYKVYYKKDGDIYKIVSQGSTGVQQLNYAFYYLSGKVAKVESENLEGEPFTSTVYVSDTKAFFPKEFTEETVSYVKGQADVMYSYFKNKL